MYETGTDILRNVACLQERDVEFIAWNFAGERVGANEVAEPPSVGSGGNRLNALKRRDPGLFHHLVGQCVGNDQFVSRPCPVAVRSPGNAIEPIIDLRRKTDRAITRERPRGRGPNYDRFIAEVLSRL